jgi:hypothetical protein
MIKEEYKQSSAWIPATETSAQKHINISEATPEEIELLKKTHPHIFENGKASPSTAKNIQAGNPSDTI